MSITRQQSDWGLFGNNSNTLATSALSGAPERRSRNSDAFANEVRGVMSGTATTPVMASGNGGNEMRGSLDGAVAGRSGKRDVVNEVRQAMNQQNQALSPEAEASLARAAAAKDSPATTPVDRLQHRALSALTNLTGVSLDSIGNGFTALREGVRGIPLNGNSLRRARGIDMPDRTGGIALDGAQQRSLEQAAANRERKQSLDGTNGASSTARAASRARGTARNSGEIGKLAARFESGSEGIAAIGYDRVGGTSYGKYQIASRPGSMDLFLKFLDANDPAMADRLRAAGPANTGNTKGEMPTVWREIAAEQPEYFEDLQEQFIHESHYEPALAAVGRAGYNTREFTPAMKEVLFSTAVQHGPVGASRIFEQAADNVGLSATPGVQRQQEKDIISEVYNLRADRFGSSTQQIQAAAKRRMEEERLLALAMS